MCRIGSFAASLPVRTRSTPSAMACASVSHLSARATPRPRTDRAVAVQAVPGDVEEAPGFGEGADAPGSARAVPGEAGSGDEAAADLVVLVRSREETRRARRGRALFHEGEDLVEPLGASLRGLKVAPQA